MKKQRHYFFVLILVPILFLHFSCASSQKKSRGKPAPATEDVDYTNEEYTNDAAHHDDEPADVGTEEKSAGTVLIPVKRTAVSYFYSIEKDNPQVLPLAENGSPDALRQVATLLKKNATLYSEQELVLLNICKEVMRIVWPSEESLLDIPQVTEANVYTLAIDSAARGLYDESTGKSDFFTLVLPSLLLLTNEEKTDFWDESREALTKALELNPNSVLANYLIGTLYLKTNEPSLALLSFAKAAQGAASNKEVQYALALSRMQTGDYENALSSAERLLVSDPQNIALLELCCDSAAALQDYDKAEQYVLRVLQLEPENVHFVLVRARILMTKGDYIKASSLLDVYSKSSLVDRDYLLLRATLQREWNKNNAAAAETIGRALSYYTEDEEILLFAAKVSGDTGLPIGGLTTLELAERVLQIHPGQKEAILISIAELGRLEAWQKAYELSTDLLSQSDVPQNDVLYSHIDICIALNYFEEALSLARPLYDAAPEDEEAQQAYVKVLVASGRQAQASKLISDLLASASNAKMKSFLYYQKSLLDTDSETILSDLRSSLTANPRNKDSLYRLYRIYYNRQDWRRAQYYLKQVVALNRSDPDMLALDAELDTLIGK